MRCHLPEKRRGMSQLFWRFPERRISLTWRDNLGGDMFHSPGKHAWVGHPQTTPLTRTGRALCLPSAHFSRESSCMGRKEGKPPLPLLYNMCSGNRTFCAHTCKIGCKRRKKENLLYVCLLLQAWEALQENRESNLGEEKASLLAVHAHHIPSSQNRHCLHACTPLPRPCQGTASDYPHIRGTQAGSGKTQKGGPSQAPASPPTICL